MDLDLTMLACNLESDPWDYSNERKMQWKSWKGSHWCKMGIEWGGFWPGSFMSDSDGFGIRNPFAQLWLLSDSLCSL